MTKTYPGSWIEEIYLGTFSLDGKMFIPVGCPNCKGLIKIQDAEMYLGYYRHKECVVFSKEVADQVIAASVLTPLPAQHKEA